MAFTFLKVAFMAFHLALSTKTVTSGSCRKAVVSDSDRHIACPKGWVPNSNTCYLFVDQERSHREAEAYCQRLSTPWGSAHLTSIGSEGENNFIRDANPLQKGIFDSLWIGYIDKDEEGVFIWTDESDSGFENWFLGQPSRGRGEDCIAMFSLSGTWNDDYCANEHKFICKMSFRVSKLHI